MIAGLHLLLVLVFPAALVLAALRDATTFVIPNWLNAAIALAFFPAALLAVLPLVTFGLCAAIGFGALALGVFMFGFGWIGGGDAKLFAAAALWLGWPALMPFLAWTAVAGGGLALLLLFVRRLPLASLPTGQGWVGRLMQPGGDVPYGVAIAVGALAAFPSSAIVHAVSGG